MKSKIFFIIFLFLLSAKLQAQDIFIEAKNITLDKKNNISKFEKDVSIKSVDKHIQSQFAEYNKNSQLVILKDKVIASDSFNNTIKSDHAEFNNNQDIFKTIGKTFLTTSENYSLSGEDIFFDNKKKIIKSNKNSILEDLSGNKIYFENFEYLSNENIFKSVGFIKIIDQYNNEYEFSQIYIDTKKKELLGADIKAFLNNENFKINNKNDPRIFANTMKLSKNESSFNKSIFTLCELKENEK